MVRWLMMLGLVAGLLAGTAWAEEAQQAETPSVDAGAPASPDEGTAAPDEAQQSDENQQEEENQSQDEDAQPE